MRDLSGLSRRELAQLPIRIQTIQRMLVENRDVPIELMQTAAKNHPEYFTQRRSFRTWLRTIL